MRSNFLVACSLPSVIQGEAEPSFQGAGVRDVLVKPVKHSRAKAASAQQVTWTRSATSPAITTERSLDSRRVHRCTRSHCQVGCVWGGGREVPFGQEKGGIVRLIPGQKNRPLRCIQKCFWQQREKDGKHIKIFFWVGRCGSHCVRGFWQCCVRHNSA